MSEIPVVVVILAGGQGSRFWPVSRMKRPKQFLSISSSGESLIQATARRAAPLSPGVPPIVVTNELHRALVSEHVPDATIVCEPVGRNTAASIGLAAVEIAHRFGNAIMVVLPADHAVGDTDALVRTLGRAVATARREQLLVTVGIPPEGPNTAYGYIRRGAPVEGDRVFRVARFFEKPNLDRAKEYVDSGEYLWNSGMFIWQTDAFFQAAGLYMPETLKELRKYQRALGQDADSAARLLDELFPKLESISVDFGILEHARNCAVVEAEPFGWNDVGAWDAWADHFQSDENGNLLKGDALAIDSRQCVVYSDGCFSAVLGVEGLVVIHSGDALLVCPRSAVQDVRKIVEELKSRGRKELI